jgi:hypothetical protein
MSTTDGFTNPVIPGFYPDPSVCRVDDEFFLVTSTFTWFPGVPIFRSRNLVNWTQIGNVLDRPSQLDLGATHGWSSLGVYAPTIRFHDGRFFMITTNVTHAGARNFFVTAEDPAGPWSEPTFVDVADRPRPRGDVDGNCRVHFASSTLLAAASTNRRRCSTDPTTWSGTGLLAPEAPHPSSATVSGTCSSPRRTHRGYGVVADRRPSARGWVPGNPILSHRSTNRPIRTPATPISWSDGRLVVDGAPRRRPKGFGMASMCSAGRRSSPIEWVDGWPVAGELAGMDRRPPGRVRRGGCRCDDFDGQPAPAVDRHSPRPARWRHSTPGAAG